MNRHWMEGKEGLLNAAPLLTSILEQTDSGVILTDEDGCIIFTNGLASLLSDHSTPDFTGKNLFDTYCRDATDLLDGFNRALCGNLVKMPAQKMEVSGLELWLEMTYQPFQLCGTRCVLITASDVTERIVRELRNRRTTAALLAIKSMDYLDYVPHDTDDAVKNIGRLIVPDLSDWCLIDFADENCFARHVTVASPRWNENEPLYEICSHYSRETASDITHDITVSDTIITSAVPESMTIEVDIGEEPMHLKWRIRPSSFVILPLPGHEKGTMTLILTESGPAYTEEDRQWLEELAIRSARIIDESAIRGRACNPVVKHTMNDTMCGVAVFNGKDLRITEANKAFANAVGEDEHDIWDRKLEEVIKDVGAQPIVEQLIGVATSGRVFNGDGYLQIGSNPNARYLKYSLTPIRSSYRESFDVMMICFDATREVTAGGKISELESMLDATLAQTDRLFSENSTLRKEIDSGQKIEQELQKVADKARLTAKEKEAMLKEINHRVKNNMQILNSLISLQIDRVQDENSRAVLKDSQSRIKSMALIHEKLYKSADSSRVDFQDYVEVLARGIMYSYHQEGKKVRLTMNVEKVVLSMNIAVHCGLIINELITNSYKHAFKDGMNGEIRVDLTKTNQGYLLVVSDNGVGIPETVNIDTSPTLGLQLVRMLVDQIDGKLEISRSWGTMFRIYFNSADLQ